MGIGIAARHERCEKYWRTHLDASKAFQRKSILSAPQSGTAVILGAGRLLDVAIDEFLQKCRRVECIDADPSARISALSRLKNGGSYLVKEITGVLGEWTTEVNECVTQEDVTKTLSNLVDQEWRPLTYPSDILLSVNLLSQIPIYWRDRVHQILKSKLSIETDDHDKLPQVFEELLQSTMRKLQTIHVRQITQSEAKLLIVIYDTAFHFYTDAGVFLTEPALLIREEFPGYSKIDEATWSWEIAPKGIEFAAYGVRHDVKAVVLSKG